MQKILIAFFTPLIRYVARLQVGSVAIAESGRKESLGWSGDQAARL